MGFGFLPNEGQPDFDALLKKFSEMGIDSGALESAKTFFETMQSTNATSDQNLISASNLREIAKKLTSARVTYQLELVTKKNSINHLLWQIPG